MDAATSQPNMPSSQCTGNADCIEGVCAFCGSDGGRCCGAAGGICGFAKFGAPLTCNANNLCVVNCGVNGSACCTDSDFAALADLYDDGLLELESLNPFGIDSVPANVAAADSAFSAMGGCFSGTECGDDGLCRNRDDLDYSYFGTQLQASICIFFPFLSFEL